MTKYKIKLYSKDKKTTNNFLKLFKQYQNKIENFPITLNFKRKKKKKNIVTILKSPHINKKAQTQYQHITYTTVGEYFSWKDKKSAICLKKIKNNLFPGLKIKIERIFDFKKNSKKTLCTKFLLTERITTAALFYKKKQTLIFENQEINPTKNWENEILQNLKKLDSYGYQTRK